MESVEYWVVWAMWIHPYLVKHGCWWTPLRFTQVMFLNNLEFEVDDLNQPIKKQLFVLIKLQIQILVIFNQLKVINCIFQFGQIVIQASIWNIDDLIKDLHFFDTMGYALWLDLLPLLMRGKPAVIIFILTLNVICVLFSERFNQFRNALIEHLDVFIVLVFSVFCEYRLSHHGESLLLLVTYFWMLIDVIHMNCLEAITAEDFLVFERDLILKFNITQFFFSSLDLTTELIRKVC